MTDARRTKASLIQEIESLRKEVSTLRAARPPDSAEALREVEARHRRLVESTSDLILEIDSDSRILYASPNCETWFGAPADELVGTPTVDSSISENIHPDDRALVYESFAPAMMRGDPGDPSVVYRFRRADGVWRWLESKGSVVQLADGTPGAVLISRDVTDREEALRRLRLSDERYRMLSLTTRDLVAELDREGRLVFVSPSSEHVIGYSPEELVGTTPFGLVHADDVEQLAELFLNRLTSSHTPRHDRIFRVRHRDGTWRWLQGGGINFTTLEGDTHVVSVSRDVTERLQQAADRRRLEERVQEAQKLESLAMMAGGIAHDFNNLLTPILGDASLALMDLPRDSGVRRHLEKIQRAGHHAATLTNQLLDYAGIGSVDAKPLDLSNLVLEMGELLQSAVSKRAVLSFDIAVDLPAVEADSAQLSQVVVNLITNASEAIETRAEGRGRIQLRSGCLQADRDLLSGFVLGEQLAAGRYVWLEVEDSGTGMDAETQGRIFDPFFTTKFTGRGLGLAAVLGIVRKHAGAIEIDSRTGHGSRIRILFPASGRPAQAAPEQGGAAQWTGRGTVLVADDDEGARDLLQETIARAGFRVLSAASGTEVLKTFRAHADEIRLVLLDRTMPGASGEEAFDSIRRVRPEVPILLVSGYSKRSTTEHFAGKHIDGFLQKPFLPEVLLEKVRALLGD